MDMDKFHFCQSRRGLYHSFSTTQQDILHCSTLKFCFICCCLSAHVLISVSVYVCPLTAQVLTAGLVHRAKMDVHSSSTSAALWWWVLVTCRHVWFCARLGCLERIKLNDCSSSISVALDGELVLSVVCVMFWMRLVRGIKTEAVSYTHLTLPTKVNV